MTEEMTEGGRIDLRAIDEPDDPHRADRIVRAAMARARWPAGGARGVQASIGAYGRTVMAAAAVLVAIAAGMVVAAQREGVQPASVLAAWSESQHVPTNGELLVAFQGYER
jgi:hypothetical protein